MTTTDDRPAFLELTDLASVRLGGGVIDANDEFFAQKENLLKPEPAVFLPHEYTDRGKWMDGWETRRRRTPGHDSCVVRLGVAGVVRGVVVDTAFFRGNYPDHASIEACSARPDASPAELASEATRWHELLPKSALRGDSQNLFAIDDPRRVTHLRLHIYPDGGVARLRVHGEVVADWQRLGRGGEPFDLVAIESGGRVLSCSDMFFGNRHNLIMPGRAVNMGDGWETKRRRGPGHDWAIVELAAEAVLRRVEIDTNHFKGNYPDTCSIEGCSGDPASAEWTEVLPRTKLQASMRHFFEDELVRRGPFTHLRLDIFPDGGVSRLRVTGVVTAEGGLARRVARLDALTGDDAARELLACCGSRAWADRVTAARPFGSLDAVLTRADAAWKELAEADVREAFLAHPRIGEREAAKEQGAAARAWAAEEQAASTGAAEATAAALAAENRAYEAKFGHVFLICATGKSADEILASLRARLGGTAAEELANAAEEQRKITRIRLEKMLR
jgi:allantoicase